MREKYYALAWYEKDPGNALIDDRQIDITLQELEKIFDDPDYGATVGCQPVGSQQVDYLQNFTSHHIDLDKYDYFVEDRKG